ncbi:MAG: AAA family ATPase, partial [Planctomycetota bacterium]
MKLISILIRAYRSFNYDYRKKYDSQAYKEKKPWEMIEDQWFPFIEIPIHSQITTIVGANESGKTHLINAVLHALGKKENFTRLDRCRYLKSANTKLYENMSVGLHWRIDEAERKRFEYLFAGLWPEASSAIEEFYLFRDPQGFLVYAQIKDGNYLRARLSAENETEIITLLPEVIELKSSLKLNKVVLIRDLILYDNFQRMEHFVQLFNKVAGVSWSARFRAIWRNNSIQDLFHFTQEVLAFLRKDIAFFAGAKELKEQGKAVLESLLTDRILRRLDLSEDAFSEQKLVETLDAFILALQKTFDSHLEHERLYALFFPREGSLLDLEIEYNLIMKTAQCERSLLYDLCESVEEVTVPNALTLLNEKLEKYLQLKSWWVQDEKIKLVVDVKNQNTENYLIFRIKDKSEAVYDMDERSSGLQYFIGYFLQYSCYEKFRKKQCLVFMDEPDRYLSRKGQKALLRIFEELSSSPVGDRPPYQVLYSTHSPFLLDRNKLERLVLLEKGPAGEGSRIHTQELFRYEPIRSAMGQAISDNLSFDYFNILVGEEHTRILIEGLLYHFYQTHPAGSYLDLNETLIHTPPSWSDLFYTLNNLKNQKNKLLFMVLFPTRQHALKTFLAQKNQLALLPYQILCMTDLHPQFYEIEDLIPYPLYRLALIEYAKKWNLLSLKISKKRTFWSDTWTFAEKILFKHHLPVDRQAVLKEFLKLMTQGFPEETEELKQAKQTLLSNFLALNQRFILAERENRFDLQDRLTLYNVLFHFRLFRENKVYSEHTILEDLAHSNLFKSHILELFQEIYWYLQTKS